MNQTTIHWQDNGTDKHARWQAQNNAKPPKRIVQIDDTTPADVAYRLACEGTGLLWQGDFQNAKALLQAIARRIDKPQDARSRTARANKAKAANTTTDTNRNNALDVFNQYRLKQSQRARTLSMLLIELTHNYSIELRRAPDWSQACLQVYGNAPNNETMLVSLRELLGIVGAYEWRKNGVAIAALGSSINNKIHPYYGVFSPIRGEYLDLVANCPLPASGRNSLSRQYDTPVFDIGTGSGVLAAILAKRGATRIVATDNNPSALQCAQDNIARLGYSSQVTLVNTDFFPDVANFGKASLIVCNPPWLPARPNSTLEHAIYDPDSQMLKGFLAKLSQHLSAHGEAWLIMSDLAEHLGLRSRAELLSWITAAGLTVLGRRDTKANHKKVSDPNDPLYKARQAEVTSLWRLGLMTQQE